MEGLPMVCYSRGRMNSLLHKVTNLMNHSSSSLAKELSELAREVEELKRDFVDKIASQPERHIQVMVWMKQVRDLVFDIEDWIDLKPDTNMVDPSDTEDIEYFKTEIKEARERFTWYDLLEQVPTQLDLTVEENISIDPLLAEEKTCHGIFNDSRDTIEKHLMDKQMRQKVVFVVGMEGLGKTTLAKEIYAKLQTHGVFECQAFVSVGRRPSMMEILNNIFRQVNPSSPPPRRRQRTRALIYEDPFISRVSKDGQMQQSIANVREYLSGKRYLIVLDGVWSTRAWKVINCALPANNRGSRVLTTTCSADVGKLCTGHPNDVVYQMTTLSEEDSKILFLSEKSKLAYFGQDYGNMLNMCGGMPIAIIVAAGLFAQKSEEMAESKVSGKSAISPLKQYSTTEGMKMILEISYADLSLPVRSCFLYLGIFPEDYTINKDRLIRLWGAEGFIPLLDKECSWVTGERYFNELISRRLVQPVFDYDDDQAFGCTIHGVILDFIRSLSREENFAIRAAELSSGPFPCDTIRRFSVDRSNEYEASTLFGNSMHLSRVRSLTVFGDAEGMFDPPLALDYEEEEQMQEQMQFRLVPTVGVTLLSFKLLRVLDLEDTKKLRYDKLVGIETLVLLRYLGLRGTGINSIPKEIRQLEQLETLDLRQNGAIRSIGKFPKLVRLLGTILDPRMDNFLEMPELEEVSTVLILQQDSLHRISELLSKPNKLRILRVALVDTQEDLILSFFEEVVKSNLHSLYLELNDPRIFLDLWEKATARAVVRFEPRRFEVVFPGFNYSVPDLIARLSLDSLSHLHIIFYRVGSEDLGILGGLPHLVYLDLTSSGHRGRSGVIEKGAFACLKVFRFTCKYGGIWLEFQKGAAPQLQRLSIIIQCSPDARRVDFSIEHLRCLTRVQAIIKCSDISVKDDVTDRIRAQVFGNPNKPTLELHRRP